MTNNKICFIIPSLKNGGAERVVVTLANGLPTDLNIHIITFYKEKKNYNINKNIKLHHCYATSFISKNSISAISNNIKLLFRIYKIIKKENIKLIIGFTTTANILSVIIAKLLKLPVIISERANPYIFKPNKLWAKLRDIFYPKCNVLVLQTKYSKSFYENKIPPKKIAILPNPLSKPLTDLKDSSVKKENIILNVGRLDKNKSQDLLIRAFSKINYTNWKLVLVGEGNKKNEYQRLVTSLNLDDHVIFTGAIKNVHYYYNKAKIFAFTSQSEGFPNALTEALHFGLACVSTNCKSGPSELIKQNINGYLIPVNNEQQLIKKLNKLTENNEIIKKMGVNASISTNKYLQSNVIKMWYKVIKSNIS